MRPALKTKSGFTLIELLVVMTIIAMLLGLSMVAFAGSRAVSRDSKRKADLQQAASALEVFRSDVGAYPASFTPSSGLCCPSNCSSNVYLQSGAVNDPSSPTYTYKYAPDTANLKGCGGANNTGTAKYSLCARLESSSPGATNPACTAAGACGGAACNYEIKSP